MKRTMTRTVLFAQIAAALFLGVSASATAKPLTATQTAHASAKGSSVGTSMKRQDATAKQKPPQQQKVEALEAVNVTAVGIRASQMRAIQIKRDAPDIEDSITAVNIGQLPDVSITDSLQRLTGVQINRSAGDGTSVAVRGLPEVSTTLNGMPFISANNIDSIQPDYGTLPASMFSGVDVFKSPTASMLYSGISGTINLRTYRPFDFKPGWHVNGAAQGGYGEVTKDAEPKVAGIAVYHGRNWGFLVGASYSNLMRNNNSNTFLTGRIAGQNASSANNASNTGIFSSWLPFNMTAPAVFKRLPDGSAEINGLRNAAYMVPDQAAVDADYEPVQRQRESINFAFETGIGDDLLLNVNAFYNRQNENDYTYSFVPEGVNHNVATVVPINPQATGIQLTNPDATVGVQDGDWNQQYYVLPSYQYFLGGYSSRTETTNILSDAHNYTARLSFDNGGPLTAFLQAADNSASQSSEAADLQFNTANGQSWGNHLMPGVTLLPGQFPGPPGQGGTHFFNEGGTTPGGTSVVINTLQDDPIVLTGGDAALIANPDSYALKGYDNSGFTQSADDHYVDIGGAYRVNSDFTVKGGVANSVRSARSVSWVGETPVYGGDGASVPGGCLERWVYDDQILDGGGVPGACTASNAVGYFHGNPVGDVPMTSFPPFFSRKVTTLNFDGIKVAGVSPFGWGSNIISDMDELTPGIEQVENPTANWRVSVHSLRAFAEADVKGTMAGVPFSGNFGLRYVSIAPNVTQFLSGAAAPYGTFAPAGGDVVTHRDYTYVLPALNLALDITPSFVWRLAASKNAMPLTLDQWGGGITESFRAVAITLPNGEHVLPVSGASSSGNPDLKPWESTNFGSSFEYYFSRSSMASIALFDMKIASFVQNSGSISCVLPDADGVVRGRCVPVSTLTQGKGGTVKGVEADYKQALTFLPGLLRDTGFEVNFTYSPSTSQGKNLLGQQATFPGSSSRSGNIIAWFQNNKWQARVALNYRNSELISTNFDGVDGLYEYEKPQEYLDMSVAYNIDRHFQVYFQAENLTNQNQDYYLTFPNERLETNFSERYFMFGARAHF